jgi:hypothetical protein
MRSLFTGSIAACALLGLLASASADSASSAGPRGNQCFFVRNFQSWKASDAKTIYIRVNLNQYYRLDLGSQCPGLLWPDARLITIWRGSDVVCSALDWDLKVGQGGVRGFAQPCIVKTMTKLDPAAAAAIPPKFKP